MLQSWRLSSAVSAESMCLKQSVIWNRCPDRDSRGRLYKYPYNGIVNRPWHAISSLGGPTGHASHIVLPTIAVDARSPAAGRLASWPPGPRISRTQVGLGGVNCWLIRLFVCSSSAFRLHSSVFAGWTIGMIKVSKSAILRLCRNFIYFIFPQNCPLIRRCVTLYILTAIICFYLVFGCCRFCNNVTSS